MKSLLFAVLLLGLASQSQSQNLLPTRADRVWLLPAAPTQPLENRAGAARAELGKKLFFDPRISGDGSMSCASCHNPSLGWADGRATAKGVSGKVLARATPTIINTSYNKLQMWDGRAATLEEQALLPMQCKDEMNTDFISVLKWLGSNEAYRSAFHKTYPGEAIEEKTLAKALANFQRTVVSNNSPFDRWLRGDAKAMSPQQVRGFQLFKDEKKGNCMTCHAAPNFTDNGFHNLGLASFGTEQADLGRFLVRSVQLAKGAFKTPTLRDIELTAPYFHDGSATTLNDVMEHYAKGGEVKTNLSPDMKKLDLTQQEKDDIVSFLKALTSTHKPFVLPQLPS